METPTASIWSSTLAPEFGGSADLVAYFFLRATSVAGSRSSIGFFATNTIAQGDTRQVGLDRISVGNWEITRATKSRQWPGAANVAISQVWLTAGGWLGPRHLDHHEVGHINTTLDAASRVSGLPFRLRRARGLSFQGSNILGNGFTMSPDVAAGLIARDRRNSEVLFPYLVGEDLTTHPRQEPSRWVINFRDWPLEAASSYPDCMDVVERLVKPERARNNERRRRELWWQFTRPTLDMYRAIEGRERVLVISQTSKHSTPAFVRSGMVYGMALVVFAYDDDFHFGVLTSAFHWWWTIKYASTMRQDIRYTPTDVFETFPQPEHSDAVALAGRVLDEHRRSMMVARNEGLTKTYNRMNNPGDIAADITELRRLHVGLDAAVAAAYGWQDLVLGHDFQETRVGIRFTVAPAAQTELLDRLLELNHARYAREQAEAATGAKTQGRRTRRSPGQLSLVGED